MLSANSVALQPKTTANVDDDDFYNHHIFSIGGKSYLVPLMWKETATNATALQPFSKFSHNLWYNVWDVSPMEVLNNPAAYPEDYKRITKADMSYPIILYNGPMYFPASKETAFLSHMILDGYHRLSRAQHDKINYITVTYITEKQLANCEIDTDEF